MPPIAAVREGATLPASRLAAHSLKTGLAVVLGSLAAISAGIFAGGVSAAAVAALLGGGVLGLFIGIALLAPRLVKPLARVVGWPARRAGGVAGELAGANAVRNPGRTASTAAALMIGLTLVTVVAVLGAGLKGSTESAINKQIHAGYVVDGENGAAVPGVRGRRAGERAGRHGRLARPLGHRARATARRRAITGIDPATIAHFYAFDWADGSDGRARAARPRRRRRDQGLRRRPAT